MRIEELEGIKAECLNALASPEFARIARGLGQMGLKDDDYITRTRLLALGHPNVSSLQDWKEGLCKTGVAIDLCLLERFLLLSTAVSTIGEVPNLPVAHSVKRHILHEFKFFAYPDLEWLELLSAGSASFQAFCRIVLLQRFPAGQWHWERSGLPRSWLFKAPVLVWAELWWFVTVKLGGFGPLVETHYFPKQPGGATLLQRESERSYYRIAKSLELQPEVKGLLAAGWFHGPDPFGVTPSRWINKVFLDNGGLVTHLGPAPPDSGYLVGSRRRAKLYESGQFMPFMGLVLWARKDMIKWAAAHPEYET